MAVDVLKSRGVPEERILFLNLIASPEGIDGFAKRFPKLRVVTAFIDQGLDEKKYVLVLINRPSSSQANILQLHRSRSR
jgi:uracil phosphoribosyltransferase